MGTFFLATLLGKGVVKVNGQALFFVNIFGKGFFEMLCKSLDQLNALLLTACGKDFGLKPLMVKGREKLLRKFAAQARFPLQKIFSGSLLGFEYEKSTLGFEDIKALYAEHEEAGAI